MRPWYQFYRKCCDQYTYRSRRSRRSRHSRRCRHSRHSRRSHQPIAFKLRCIVVNIAISRIAPETARGITKKNAVYTRNNNSSSRSNSGSGSGSSNKKKTI